MLSLLVYGYEWIFQHLLKTSDLSIFCVGRGTAYCIFYRFLSFKSSRLVSYFMQVRLFDSTHYLKAFAVEDVWVAVGWSSDVLPAAIKMRNVAVIVPKSGASLWADLWVCTCETLCLLHIHVIPLASDCTLAMHGSHCTRKSITLLNVALGYFSAANQYHVLFSSCDRPSLLPLRLALTKSEVALEAHLH